VIVKTGRFGQLTIDEQDVITIPAGVLGFPEYTKFCLVDAADDTLILWLQSLDNPEIAFAVLEPKVFRTDYSVRLSAAELRELKLENVNQSAVFSILTIPADVTLMTANIKAPIVINLRERIAKQVVLQENEYSIKHLMFKELRAHLITIQSQAAGSGKPAQEPRVAPVAVKDIPPSLTVRSLQA
jgi:flagellar assembly factor FliW